EFRKNYFFFFSSRRRHTRFSRDWSSDVCSSDLDIEEHEGDRDPAQAAVVHRIVGQIADVPGEQAGPEQPQQRRGSDPGQNPRVRDRKSTRLNSSHVKISYAVFCLKKKKEERHEA